MAKKVFNKQGGLHSDAAYTALESRIWGSCVGDLASFAVTPGAGMNLSISTGDGLIKVDSFNGRRIQTTTVETVAVPASSPTFGRLDTVVAYIDTAVVASTAQIDNTNDMLKFMVVAGTAAATPVAPTGAAIQAAIGAGNPYMPLYDCLVPQSATNTAGVTLTDRRALPTVAFIPDNIVTTAKIANNAVTNAKIAANTVAWDRLNKSTVPLVHVNADVSGSYAHTTATLLKVSGTAINTVPSAFTIDTANRRIVIGTGVTRVKVSVNVFHESNTAQYVYSRLRKNAVEMTQVLQNQATTQFNSTQIPVKVIDVAPGDYLDFYIEATGNIRGGFSYMTVEAMA
jgi:hypothetical protein